MRTCSTHNKCEWSIQWKVVFSVMLLENRKRCIFYNFKSEIHVSRHTTRSQREGRSASDSQPTNQTFRNFNHDEWNVVKSFFVEIIFLAPFNRTKCDFLKFTKASAVYKSKDITYAHLPSNKSNECISIRIE